MSAPEPELGRTTTPSKGYTLPAVASLPGDDPAADMSPAMQALSLGAPRDHKSVPPNR